MKKRIIIIAVALGVLFACTALGATLQGYQGGTGFATSTAGNNGKCLQQSSSSPFLTWTIAACGSGGGTISTSSATSTGYFTNWVGSGLLSVTSNLYQTSSTGNVGVNSTSTPSVLTIRGIADNQVLQLQQTDGTKMVNINTSGGHTFEDLYQSGGSTIGVHLNASGTSYFNGSNVSIGTTTVPTNGLFTIATGTSIFVCLKTGNCGFGTAAPGGPLVVISPSGFAGNIADFQSSGGSSRLSVDSSGNVTAGNTLNVPTVQGNSSDLLIRSNGTVSGSGSTGISLTNQNTLTFTAGTADTVKVLGTFGPTSGSATYSSLEVAPTINQTSGANGITRGLYVNPTVTSSTDFRSFEVATGTTRLGGNTIIGSTNTPSSTVHVVGTLQVTQTSTFQGNVSTTIPNAIVRTSNGVLIGYAGSSCAGSSQAATDISTTGALNCAGFAQTSTANTWALAQTFTLGTTSNGTSTFNANVILPNVTSTVLATDSTGKIVATTTAAGANPTATIGTTAVNGTANTFMRSDAAPALAPQYASSTWSLNIANATTTASTTNYAFIRTNVARTLTAFGCYDTVGTTTLNIFIPTAFATTTVSSTVNSSFACGVAGNTSSSNISMAANSYLIVEVSSTAATPVGTQIYFDTTKN